MKTEIVKFYEDEITAYVNENSRPYVAVRTMANTIGLHADSALTGIKNDEILSESLVEQHGTGADGKRYLMQFLPIDHVAGWLFSIDVNKVNADVKPKLILYKRECYQVLYEHFFGKHKVVSDNQRELAMISNRMREIDKMIREGLKERKNIQLQKTAIEMENFRQLGIAFDDSEEIEIFDNNKGFLSKAL
jgi:hypothetical protein